MSRDEYLNLLSQKKSLEELIAKTPSEDAIDLHSLKNRLSETEAKLTMLGDLAPAPLKARLTFKGKAVIGSYGIFASFASKALDKFNDAVDTVAVALTSTLAPSGPLRARSSHLIITRTALGSFGFELEETNPTEEDECGIAQALKKTQQILEASTIQDDDALADAIADIPTRATEKIKGFLQEMQTNETICAFHLNDHDFRFSSLDQIERSIERISTSNVREIERIYTGSFFGTLPSRKNFEFRVDGERDILVGNIANSIEEDISEKINRNLFKRIRIKVLVKTVGHGRPRFTLLEEPDWDATLPDDTTSY